jgi:signal transduction histidine kinase
MAIETGWSWRAVPPPAADAGIAAGVALLSLAGGLVTPGGGHAAVTAVLVAMGLVLAARRRFPCIVLAVVAALACLLAALGASVEGTFIAVLIASYTAAVHGGPRVARALLILAPAVLLGLGIPQALGAGGWAGAHLPVRPLLAAAGMWLAGLVIRKQFAARAEHAAVLAERAELIAAQQEERTRSAALAERVRIARELHDIVAHHLSVVVIQAQGAQRVAEKDPARAKIAMADVERTGRTALSEMRHLLGLLRTGEPGDRATPAAAGPDAAFGPPFGLADLENLAEAMRTAGLPVTVVRRGPPREVPEDAGLTVYRIVQESLTNVLKHAGAATATVELDSAAELAVTITDDGRGASAALDAIPGAGRGTAGMRERVAALGGKLTAGPRSGGGYRVRATIPLGPS